MSQPPAPAGPTPRLVLITGQEGAGKTTIIRALAPHTPQGARIDAEDLGQINPCHYDEAFWDLLRRNVAALAHNYWRAGYRNVIAGSFFTGRTDYLAFRALLPRHVDVYVVQLHVDREARDHRRLTREKQTTREWRDRVDAVDRPDTTLSAAGGDYRYLAIDNSRQTPADTVAHIMTAIPEIYG